LKESARNFKAEVKKDIKNYLPISGKQIAQKRWLPAFFSRKTNFVKLNSKNKPNFLDWVPNSGINQSEKLKRQRKSNPKPYQTTLFYFCGFF